METVEEFKFKVWRPHLRDYLPKKDEPGNGAKSLKCLFTKCYHLWTNLVLNKWIITKN